MTGLDRKITLPLGLWAEHFKELAPSSRDYLIKERGAYPRGSDQPARLDFDRWRAIRDALSARETWFAAQLREVEGLVVNAEGSIHHNLPRALALAAMIDIAKEAGLPVALMNATIQGMDRSLMRRVMPGIGLCQLREDHSLREVSPFLASAFTSPDIAVFALRAMSPPQRARAAMEGRRCIVSHGVLANEKTVRETINVVRKCGFDPTYLSIGDGQETEMVSRLAPRMNLAVLHAGEIGLEDLMEEIAKSALVISGRHHVNIFSMFCGVPIVPLPSNTWKIEATLQMADYPVSVVSSPKNLKAAIDSAYAERIPLGEASEYGFSRLVEKSRELPERVTSWIS
ncbi:polysaccharide pyruvyl transferase family protein [Rhodovulum marinum]|uniref:Polysaccharide pyruvyl transferase n=1 Tax=Rhodovulum marinum TaxID=320662 RepID=A0A4R2PXE9_9RHOB|nr:polysaccharide pyruvyl transferase family protein [Rhodovulum marinum]TCP39818.1 polysaccharide pyruvyl transferase [Rhodovulum marinum]